MVTLTARKSKYLTLKLSCLHTFSSNAKDTALFTVFGLAEYHGLTKTAIFGEEEEEKEDCEKIFAIFASANP